MKKDTLKIAFFGTPDLAVYVLEELENSGFVPTVVVTAPDKPAGRTLQLTSPPVKLWAEEHNIAVIQPNSLREDPELDVLRNSDWDVCIVAAYAMILPSDLLSLPACGVLNVHPSLLPKNRGPSPIRSAIRNDTKDVVGVSIIVLDEEMDHGPIVAQASVALDEWPIRGRVLDEILFREGGKLLGTVLPEWLQGNITPEEQAHSEATYTKKILKSDGELLESDSEHTKYSKFCAYDGWPGTYFFTYRNGKKIRIKVTDATYEDGTFKPRRVIPEGKKEIDFDVWRKSVKAEKND